jgi:hypothetical protein
MALAGARRGATLCGGARASRRARPAPPRPLRLEPRTAGAPSHYDRDKSHTQILPNGEEIKLQRNALSVIELGPEQTEVGDLPARPPSGRPAAP